MITKSYNGKQVLDFLPGGSVVLRTYREESTNPRTQNTGRLIIEYVWQGQEYRTNIPVKKGRTKESVDSWKEKHPKEENEIQG